MQVLADANGEYGPGKDQVDCSRFVAAILVNVGIKLDDESFDAIQMTDLAGTTKAAKDARDVAVSGELDESRRSAMRAWSILRKSPMPSRQRIFRPVTLFRFGTKLGYGSGIRELSV